MTSSLMRLYAWCFSIAVIAYSIAFYLYLYEGMTFLQAPAAGLELLSYINFLAFAASAFETISFRWLWVLLSLVAEIAIPSAISLLVTLQLSQMNAARIWAGATFFAVSILKLAIAGGILLWRIGHDRKNGELQILAKTQ
jgi:hypothetical protein